MLKMIVFGLDGGTWNIIKPMVKKGKLPTITKLMNNGCYGNLESTFPYGTFPAWKCYSTGKNPGKLGAFSFLDVDTEKQKITANNSFSFKSKELWDYLNENDIVCGVLDMPTTYPPKEVNGFMVSHSLINVSNYTYPKGLSKELNEKLNYKLNPEYLYLVDKDRTITDCTDIINQRFDAAKYLLKKFNPAFLHMTVFYIDHIQHYYWKYMEENDLKYGKVIENFWILIDNGIKSLLDECCNEKTYVFLMSDHGFTSVKGDFNFARWAINKGYLSLNYKAHFLSTLGKLGISVDNIVHIMKKLKIYSVFRNFIPTNLQLRVYKLLPSKDAGSQIESVINLKRSKVIPISEIYINKSMFKNIGDYEKFRDKLMNEMENITDPAGEKVFDKLYKKEDVYSGPYMDHSPDILKITKDYVFTTNLSPNVWNFTPRWSGYHELNGIFLAYGPDIKKSVEIQSAHIYDLAPIILHLLGVPIPNDMDGRVLTEIFEEDSELGLKEFVYRDYEKEKIKERIKGVKKFGKL